MKLAKEIYMYVLGLLILVGAFLFGVILATYEIPVGNKDVVMVAVGIMFGWGGAVVTYFFGTSKSSSDKNEIIAKSQNESK